MIEQNAQVQEWTRSFHIENEVKEVQNILWQSDYFKFKQDEDLTDGQLVRKKILQNLIGKISSGSLLIEKIPSSYESKGIKKLAEDLYEQYFKGSEVTNEQVHSALNYVVSSLIADSNTAFDRFDIDQFDGVRLISIVQTEVLLKRVDEKVLHLMLKELMDVFGYSLTKSLSVTYTDNFGTSSASYGLNQKGKHTVHEVILGVGTQMSLLKDLKVSKDISIDDFFTRVSMIIHELTHAFTSDLFKEEYTEDYNEKQSTLRGTLLAAFEEGFSMMAERLLFFRLEKHFLSQGDDKMASMCRKQLENLVRRDNSLRKEMLAHSSIFDKHAPYVYGIKILRKLKSEDFRDLLVLVQSVPRDEFEKVKLSDVDIEKVLADPKGWLQERATI